jgi:hypothetical protein
MKRAPLRSRLLPLAALALAAAAVATHLLGWGTPSKDADLRQGAYRPLVPAEADLAAGRFDAALEGFQRAAMRAVRFGRLSVFDRIRQRAGSAGLALDAAGGRAEAWPFLARFALWSPDFDRTSRRLEAKLLMEPGWGPEFAYPLVLRNGRTAWNQKPDWVSLRVPEAWLSPEKRGLLQGYSAARVPEAGSPGARFVLFTFFLAHATQDSQTAIRLSGAPGPYRWFPRLNGQILWEEPFPAGPRPPQDPFARRELFSLGLIGIGAGPPPPVTLGLVHVYKAL